MLHDAPELYKGLTYPWSREVNPEPGQAEKIADGVYWARFPMPMSLDHINLWLLEDGDGWTVVDTCLNMKTSRDIWEQLFGSVMQGRPITRVICTHLHPDHVGLAGWLTERFDAEVVDVTGGVPHVQGHDRRHRAQGPGGGIALLSCGGIQRGTTGAIQG